MGITQVVETIKSAFTKAPPNDLADLFRKLDFGAMLDPIDATITLAAVSATVNLVTATVAEGGKQKAAHVVRSVRVTDVTGGTADAGLRMVAAAGGTPAAAGAALAGVCTLSADGKTLTFEGTVKAIRVVYLPAPATPLTDAYPLS